MLNDLFEFIRENELLSEPEIGIVQTCIDDIKEIAPTDRPALFQKMERLVQDAENLSWCIYSVKVHYSKIKKAYRMLKDGDFTVLVRQGRPSTEAINSELRWKDPTLYDWELKMETVENLIEYLNHILVSMDKYQYMLKDKLRYDD
jgi:hypothetical protein